MRKLALITLLTALMVVMAVSVASAVEPYYHGDFADNSLGCAKCHVTHAATAKALLVYGTNQTEFCMYCHSALSKSPYDALSGKILTTTGKMPSVAGGFVYSYNFDAEAYDEVGGAVNDHYIDTTSMHGVESYDNNDWITGSTIPGGKTALGKDFRCGSCHDPHAGGDYADGDKMPRLMRLDLPVTADLGTVANYQDWTFEKKGNSTGAAGFKTATLSGYGNYAGQWCAGCHDLFNQTAHDAGQSAVNHAGTGVVNKYMHRMNFTVTDDNDGVDAIVNANVYKVALSVGNQLTCLTCHRAHGTASDTSSTEFDRATTYKDSAGGTSDTSTSSVLLREANRDVCYDCHGAAAFNKPSNQ